MIYAYIENSKGKYKKEAYELITYAKILADEIGDSVTALTINSEDSSEHLYKFGATKVINIQDESLRSFNPKVYASVLSKIIDGNYILFAHTNESVSIAPYIVKEKSAAYITQAISKPLSVTPFKVKRSVFSGKGIAVVETQEPTIVLTLSVNSVGAKENPVSGTEEKITVTTVADPTYQVKQQEVATGKLDVKVAELVVGAGRGMKGPENWGIIEDLANVLGAATACTKPVADLGWRPHAEHVGQTGKTISPKLYIAIGISGAVQHVAGITKSKTIVVINNDPQAPFFKTADYGVIGDLFEVVPELTKKLKAFKDAH
ncbi:electron transfer flavoprotein subunit alpha/FixB family protein [Apibacter sp. B3706]|uniref:electron transfer flavoprotein subunit alpha/FixB family protein n=1 Tax=Apibacter sp. B3706 TaxID=2656760 RepID=UPI0014096555|nr:electron transfer flavoprotein subunit alpha/FixB family protein [Apibacter sp. B3706]QII70152.1 electron transfer flavoprotein subunit alpha/FixB family protein [Apibacter sp. B3706]